MSLKDFLYEYTNKSKQNLCDPTHINYATISTDKMITTIRYRKCVITSLITILQFIRFTVINRTHLVKQIMLHSLELKFRLTAKVG